MEVPTKCDKRIEENVQKTICIFCKELRNFKADFQQLVDVQKKAAERLWILVLKYKEITKGCESEELYRKQIVEDMKSKVNIDIQEKTTAIWEAIQNSTEKLTSLENIQKRLENESKKLNWSDYSSTLINGCPHQLSLNKILETSSDICFQFDVALTSMRQYFSALELANPGSYELLMNSIVISEDLITFTEEFLALNTALINSCKNK